MVAEATQSGHSRRLLPIVLIVVASLVAVAAVAAIWAKRQVLETDTWVQTSSDLLEREVIRDAVADYVVNELFDNVDVQAGLEQILPPVTQPLAGPVAGALRNLAGEAAREALASGQVQAIWEDANRAAQEKLLALLEDEGEFVATTGGVVTLDLTGVLREVVERTGLPGKLVDRLPPEAGELEIMRSDELASAQKALNIFETAVWLLAFIALGLYALAIFIARDRRRETMRAVGFAFAFVGALILVAHGLAGEAVTDSLASTAAAEAPVTASWEIGTSLLTGIGQGMIGYGVVVVLAAWLAGPTKIAVRIRTEISPHFRQPSVAIGTFAVLVLLIFWWSPTQGTERLLPSLVLIVLLAIGLEALRRQIVREFPVGAMPPSPDETPTPRKGTPTPPTDTPAPRDDTQG